LACAGGRSAELIAHLPPPYTGRKRFLQSTGIPVKSGDANAAQRIIDDFVRAVAEPAIKHAKLARRGDGIVPVMQVEHSPHHTDLPLLANCMVAARLIGTRRLHMVPLPAPPENRPVDVETIIGLWTQDTCACSAFSINSLTSLISVFAYRVVVTMFAWPRNFWTAFRFPVAFNARVAAV
jgi:hypothetical protein